MDTLDNIYFEIEKAEDELKAIETMTEEQRQQSWLTMKQQLVDLCWELLREDPANLNTLQRCHDHIKENFELLAAVRQIDPRCKP